MKRFLTFFGIAVLILFVGYWLGVENTHAELLAQCKGEERGIHLSVGNKRYFYYCSYEKP